MSSTSEAAARLRRPQRVGRDRGDEPAAAIAEVAEARQLGRGLRQEIHAGHPEIGDTVGDELDDVVRPDEQDVEVEVLDACDEAPIMLLEDEAGVVEEGQRRLDEPALVGDGQAEAVAHQRRPAPAAASAFRRSSIAR